MSVQIISILESRLFQKKRYYFYVDVGKIMKQSLSYWTSNIPKPTAVSAVYERIKRFQLKTVHQFIQPRWPLVFIKITNYYRERCNFLLPFRLLVLWREFTFKLRAFNKNVLTQISSVIFVFCCFTLLHQIWRWMWSAV